MAKGPKYRVKFRREREGKTDYKKRLALLKSRLPRFVVRVSNKNVLCQVIAHEGAGDKAVASCSSKELAKLGWKASRSNIPAAYLVGYLFQGGPAPPCMDEANVDALVGPAGPVDVADLTYLVGYLFQGGPAPGPCP